MFEKLNWLLMVLPFALWGTAMAAMAPLVKSGGPELVATLRLLPAGIAIILAASCLQRQLGIAKIDLGWFLFCCLIAHSNFPVHISKINTKKDFT